MSIQPDSFPDFDLGPEITYCPVEISQRVLWPLVSAKWDNEDWRQKSPNGAEFVYPKTGRFQGRLLEVTLQADTDEFLAELSTDEYENIHYVDRLCSVTLYIEEIADGSDRGLLLEAARRAVKRLNEIDRQEQTTDHDEPDHDEFWEWPVGEEDEFIVRRCVAYSFDTDGDWHSEMYRSVEGDDGVLNIPFCEAQEDMMVFQEELKPHDIDEIEAACYVLKAPQAILAALQAIKNARLI